MARRRWLLFALSTASLVLLTYASVLFAFSVPASAAMREANGETLPAGDRIIVLPLADLASAPTHAEGGDGALLVLGERGGNFPSSARGTSLARALARVDADAPSTLELTDVPMPNGTQNLTLDLEALGVEGAGFVVKGDAEEAPRFAPDAEVIGQVDHVESTASLGLLFASGALGFVVPLVGIIATHRGAGRQGPPADDACHACRAPLAADADFCTRCGEYRKDAP